ncbi:MAG: PilZ domain-containing protein [Desulfobulbaceae bacterium]|nr:PilZ domain-containing protein [Desulfobulbaceae bacterium]
MTIRNPRDHDKRSFARYPTKESCAVMLTPGHIMSYCMLDISKTGLAFCYDGKADASKLLNNVAVTIFTENDISPDISVQIVSDTEISEENLCNPSEKGNSQNRYLRRCGIKFNSLSQSQKKMIHGYIQNLEAN